MPVVDHWRGRERRKLVGYWLKAGLDMPMEANDLVVLGPMDEARQRVIEALPAIKVLGLPADRRVKVGER